MARIFGLPDPDHEPADAELPEHLRAVWTAKWLEFILRAKLPPARMAVAIALATFADTDGSNVRPALQTVADMANTHESKAHDHIKALLALGLLAVKVKGGGRSNPNTYRLTRPADITTLPLWLDNKWHRVPADAAFVPAQRIETPPPTVGNAYSSNTDSPAPTVGNPAETVPPTVGNEPETVPPEVGNRPVDNPDPAGKGTDSGRKGYPFEAERVPPAVPDLTSTYKQDHYWSSQASTSLAGPGEDPPALADLVGTAADDPWTPGAADPPPRIVRGSAVLLPTPEAYAVAHAAVTAAPGAGEFFLAAAARDIRAEGIPDPPIPAVMIRAAEILHRTDTETRTA